MTQPEFQPGDLVRFSGRNGEPNNAHVHFARVLRVHQSWLEFHPGEFGARRIDCELVNRPSENNEDIGLVALAGSQLVALAHLASVAGEPSAEALWAEVERTRRLPWRAMCEDAKAGGHR